MLTARALLVAGLALSLPASALAAPTADGADLRLQFGIAATGGRMILHGHASGGLPNGLPTSGTSGRPFLEAGVQAWDWLVVARLARSMADYTFGDTLWNIGLGHQLLDTPLGRTAALLTVGHDDGHLGGGIHNEEGVFVLGPTVGASVRHVLDVWGPLAVGVELSYDLMLADRWYIFDDMVGKFDGRAKVGLLRATLLIGADLPVL
jgi:hypothetical protein